jgi:hypothetical protein
MFNPLKKFADSLAQTQELNRQQREKIERRHNAPKALFDADDEQSLFVNGDESKPKLSSDGSVENGLEEENSSAEKKEELSKELRIKLVKLAKYEDRHPSEATWYSSDVCVELQAAYKESQARIATFERLLRERTPLASIDDVDDFGNYLNTLSMRTNVLLLLLV